MVSDAEISKYRSEVIEKFINLEWIINLIITTNYLGKPMINFMYDVLYDEYFSFGLKRRILEKILKEKNEFNHDKIESLNRMNTIRNYFAHCFNKISPDGKTEFVPDPRKKWQPIDFEKLYKEFIENEKIGLDYLLGFYQKIGGITPK